MAKSKGSQARRPVDPDISRPNDSLIEAARAAGAEAPIADRDREPWFLKNQAQVDHQQKPSGYAVPQVLGSASPTVETWLQGSVVTTIGETLEGEVHCFLLPSSPAPHQPAVHNGMYVVRRTYAGDHSYAYVRCEAVDVIHITGKAQYEGANAIGKVQ